MMAQCILILLALAGASAARTLRQDVHSISSAGKNPVKKTNLFAQAREAESRANPLMSGLFHNEATNLVESGGLFPAPRGTAGSQNNQQVNNRVKVQGGPWSLPIDAFGPTAHAAVDTERARAISSVEGTPMARDDWTPATFAKGTTAVLYDAQPLHRGTGKLKAVQTDSYGANSLAPLSHGISNVGGGPIAVAAAGEAVSIANADTPENGWMARR